MPNIGGSRAAKRRTLCSVIHSQMLYAAQSGFLVPIKQLSTKAAGIIAGVPSIELQIIKKRDRYTSVERVTAKGNTMHSWQTKWHYESQGRCTHTLIRDIERRLNRSYGEPDCYLSPQHVKGYPPLL